MHGTILGLIREPGFAKASYYFRILSLGLDFFKKKTQNLCFVSFSLFSFFFLKKKWNQFLYKSILNYVPDSQTSWGGPSWVLKDRVFVGRRFCKLDWCDRLSAHRIYSTHSSLLKWMSSWINPCQPPSQGSVISINIISTTLFQN